MKKILQKVGITILTIPFLLALGCKAPEYSSETDTVLTLGTPSVKGIAYPGVNYVYWDTVANAKNGYRLDIYENGILINDQTKVFDEKTTSFIDTDIQNNVEKTYKVCAIGDSQARALYFTEGSKGSVSLKGIVPPVNTSAINLALYEKGYDPDSETEYEFTDEQKAVLLSEDTVNVVQNEDSDTFNITFPAKPYLKYEVYAESGNSYELFGHSSPVAVYENPAAKNDDKTVTVTASVSVSGDYTIYVKASSINTKYSVYDEITAKNTISYSTLDLLTPYAALIREDISVYTSANSGIVYWVPARLLDGSYVPASYYKIYKTIIGQNKYNLVDVEVKEYTSVTSTEKLYYIEETDLDCSKLYTYRFVITDGKHIAKVYTEACSLYNNPVINSLNSDVTAEYTDANTIKIAWTPNTLDNGSTAPATAYTVYRKVQGSDDSTYTALSAAVEETTITGSTKYVVEDSITNNTVGYVYMLSLNNGTKILNATVSVSAYKEIYKTGTTEAKASYIKDDTARIMWIPDVVEGKTLAISDYKLYRKGYYKADTEYTPVTDEIKSAYTQNNFIVYYVDTAISDTTSAYKYLLEYQNGNTIYQSIIELKAYSKAVVLSTPVITFIANESDGIENDAKIEIKVSDEQVLSAVKYIELDTKSYLELDADYPNILNITEAEKTTVDNTTTYTWILSDVAEGNYISVVAIVDDNASFATTANASASEPAFTTSTTGSNISIDLLDSDADGLSDDAFVIVTLADIDKVLSSVTYASADSKDAAIEASVTGTKLTYSTGYNVYAFTVKDAVSPEVPYFAISAVISEEGKKDAVITNNASYSNPTADILLSSIFVKDWDEDGLVNDIYFGLYAAPEQEITVTYAIANTADNAKLLLDSAEAKVLVEKLTGYKFYEFSPDNYEALHNLPLGKYIAISVTATDDEATSTVSKIINSTQATYDAYAGLRTDAPIFNMTKIAADEDGLVNDIYMTVEIYKTQTLKELIYATSDEEITNLESLRLDSENVNDLTASVTKKYETADKIIYEAFIKDLEVGTRVAAKATAGETDKVYTSVTKTTSAVTADPIILTQTDNISADQTALYFTAYDNDSNYNDVKQDTIHLTLGIDQSIKSIRWAAAEDITSTEKLLRTDSTAANTIYIPTTYQLNTSVSYGISTLTKTYSVTVPEIKNIAEGNVVVASIIISEPGYLDREIFITTEEWTYTTYSPEYDEVNIPEYAWERPVVSSDFTADDSKNYEYVHVQIADFFTNDSVENYTYKLERTYEDTYRDSDAVWETIEETISLEYSNGYYKFDKWYKDIPVGKYVYRLTKTRKASGEKIVEDIAVKVVYYVDAPKLSFSSYESENMTLAATEYMNPNYDYLDKYNYILSYYVTYKDAYGTTISTSETKTITGWSWKAVLDEDGKETGNYTLINAVISGINKIGSATTATVTPILTKIRKIATDNTDFESASLQINWGLSASIAADSEITINSYYESTVDSIKYFIVYADTGYDSYQWYVDSVLQDEKTNSSIAINTNELTYGSHDILVKAKKGGVTYSTSISYTK